MAPPPKPPIICYDLHTNNNARRNNNRAPTVNVASRRSGSTCSKVVLKSDPIETQIKPLVTSYRFNSDNARHAYGNMLRQEAEEKERHRDYKRTKMNIQEQLDSLAAQLESAKRMHENIMQTFGVGHTTAEYIRKQDEDYAKLRQKIDQFAETRSRELSRRTQQMKKQQLDMQHQKPIEPPKQQQQIPEDHSSHSSSSTVSISNSCSTPPFSFYKPPSEQDTIEVSDMDFFAKVEDKTMMEVDELLNRMRTTLNELNYELK